MHGSSAAAICAAPGRESHAQLLPATAPDRCLSTTASGSAYPPPPNAYSPPQGNTYPPPPANYLPPPPPSFNVHNGFYLRLHLGAGFTSVTGTDAAGSKFTISGGSGSFGIALGGAVAPNLIVFGNLFGTDISDPSGTVDGVDIGTAGSGTNANVSGIGVGVAYYIEPMNLYLSGTLAAMSFAFSDSNGRNVYESDVGFGLQGMVGKEWWISQDWGLGIAGELLAASMKDKTDPSITWTATAFSLLFSATYN